MPSSRGANGPRSTRTIRWCRRAALWITSICRRRIRPGSIRATTWGSRYVKIPLQPGLFSIMGPGLPGPPAGQPATPLVRVVTGQPSGVQWSTRPALRQGEAPQADIHIEAPATEGSAYFELLLGYQEPTLSPPALHQYTVVLDSVTV